MFRPVALFILVFLSFSSYAQQQWTFLKGNASDYYDVYGTIGQGHPNNTPGFLNSALTWSGNGKLYLYGGHADFYSAYCCRFMDNLWEYDTLTTNWQRLKGTGDLSQPATYGVKGIGAVANTPGSRTGGATWFYNNRLYMFSSGEMWYYDLGTGYWVWAAGSPSGTTPVFGTKGVASASTTPGSISLAAHWQYNSRFYLYGGGNIWEFDPATEMWTWINGVKTNDARPVFGAQGVPSATAHPGSRMAPSFWFVNDKLYLFSGMPPDYSSVPAGYDLWVYDMTTGLWAWLKGASLQPVYGTKGVAHANNEPGVRVCGITWHHGSKLFFRGGRSSYNHPNPVREDLWEYDISTNNWTWIDGSTDGDVKPKFAISRTASSQNRLGSRTESQVWQLGHKVFVMGGPWTRNGTIRHGNDLWDYDANTNKWRWIKGNPNQMGFDVRGSLGFEHYLNTPSRRINARCWQLGDSIYVSGGDNYEKEEMWRFNNRTGNWACIKESASDTPYFTAIGALHPNNSPGGNYLRAALAPTWAHNGALYLYSKACMWKYDVATNQWAILKLAASKVAVHGTKGVATAANNPGERQDMMWWQANGKFYLFGGEGWVNTTMLDDKKMNDLWEYDPATNNWTWIKGSHLPEQNAVYGTKGLAAANNTPGARYLGSAWVLNNKLYLFSGIAHDASGPGASYINDLWEYDIATGNWTWLKGSNDNFPYHWGVYGTKGVAAVTNMPGARLNATTWTLNNKLYLFGGNGYLVNTTGSMNDLWEYDPSSNNWTFIAGTNQDKQSGVYEREEQADPGNMAGFRYYAVGWTGNNRLYLFSGAGRPANAQPFVSNEYKNDIWYYEPCNSPSQCYPNPPAVSLPDVQLCSGDPVMVDAGNTGCRFQWSTGDTTRQIAIAATGTYWVKVTNPAGLHTYDTANVTVGAYPVVNLGADTSSMCSGTPLVLDAGNPGASYFWSTGQSTKVIGVNWAGAHSVTVRTPGNCISGDTINVNAVRVSPAAPIGFTNAPICAGDTLLLSASSSTAGVKWEWQGPNGFMWFFQNPPVTYTTVADSGDYIVSVTKNDCTMSDTILAVVASIKTPSVSIVASPSGNVGPWAPVSFVATTVFGGAAPIYQWQKNGADIAGATSDTYTGVMGMDFAGGDQICVRIISNEPCTVTDTALSNCVTVSLNLGTENIYAENEFSIFPNPSNGQLILRGPLQVGAEIIISDVVGRVVYKDVLQGHQQANYSITVPNAKNGMYFLHIKAGDKFSNIKFSIEQ